MASKHHEYIEKSLVFSSWLDFQFMSSLYLESIQTGWGFEGRIAKWRQTGERAFSRATVALKHEWSI